MDYFDQLEARLVALTASGAHRRRGRPAFGVPRFGLGALAAALSVLVVLGVVGVVLSAGSHKQAPAAAPPVGRGAISTSLVRNYRVLRRPVESADRLPAAYVRHSTSYGLLPALARRVVIPNTRLEMWLEPGQRGFCVLIAERTPSGAANTGGFGGTCQPAALQQPAVAIGGGAFLAAGPPMSAHPGEPHLASGVLPDSVTSVELVTAAGRRSTVTTTDGFFAVRVNPNDHLYAVTDGRRQQIIPLGARPGVTAQSIPAGLQRAFAIFRRPRTAADRIPSHSNFGNVQHQFGVNPDLSRLALSTPAVHGAPAIKIWLVPGTGFVCEVEKEGAHPARKPAPLKHAGWSAALSVAQARSGSESYPTEPATSGSSTRTGHRHQ
jgi:hypothetical protein